MIQSRITSKAQTTIPSAVRKALGLKEGDLVSYRIEQGCVIMTRAEPAGDDPSLRSPNGTARRTGMPMADSEARFAPGTVIAVPFLYTDAETRQHRPALVVATAGSGAAPFLLWVVMITSAANRGWAGDVAIPDAGRAGLPAPSLIRTAKIATIDMGRAEARGGVEATILDAVRVEIAGRLGLSPGLGG